MKILIVAVDYSPDAIGIAPYNAGLAEHLASRGHEVTVLTTFPHYPEYRWQQSPAAAVTTESLNRVTVRRAWVLLPRNATALWRIAFDTSFGVSMRGLAWHLPPQDLVLAIFPPAQGAIAATRLARKWRAPLCVLVQDLPVQAALSTGMLRDGIITRAGRRVEAMTLGAADRVVIIDNGFAPYLSQLGVGQNRINQIPNWIDIDAIRPMEPDVESRKFLGAGADDFLVLHAGNLGRKQAVDYVAHLFARLDSRFKLVVIGAGTRADTLHELNLDNVRVLSLQPAEDLPRLLAAADAVLLSQRREVVDSVVPSKLLMYLASGRPVIAAVNELSPAARIVRESDGGILVQPENSTALDSAVKLLAGDPTARATHGLHGRAYAVRNYERGAVLDRWDRLLAEITAGHVAGRTRVVT